MLICIALSVYKGTLNATFREEQLNSNSSKFIGARTLRSLCSGKIGIQQHQSSGKYFSKKGIHYNAVKYAFSLCTHRDGHHKEYHEVELYFLVAVIPTYRELTLYTNSFLKRKYCSYGRLFGFMLPI